MLLGAREHSSKLTRIEHLLRAIVLGRTDCGWSHWTVSAHTNPVRPLHRTASAHTLTSSPPSEVIAIVICPRTNSYQDYMKRYTGDENYK